MQPFLLALLLVDFQKQVASTLQTQCLSCHAPGKAQGGLRVDTAEGIRRAVTPGQPEKSPLYLRTQLPAGKPGAMPPGGPALTKDQSDSLKAWISEGAKWPDEFVLRPKPSRRAPDDLALARKLYARMKSAEFKPYKQTVPNTDVSYEMVTIPAGEFVMGTPETEKGHRKDESPRRNVKLEAFWMGKYEVTWDEYRLFMFPKDPSDEAVDAISRPTRPYVEMSFGMGINGFPAISMTQHAANKYAQWLSARTGHFYRLPTEAEWEYACRAGSATTYPFGDDPSKLGEYGVFNDERYAKIGTKKPNAWGLYDMLGNVMEWTLDGYAPYAPAAGLLVAPWVKATTPYPQVARGGGWVDGADRCRCGARAASDPSWKMQDPQLPKSIWYLTDAQWLGFRLVRPLKIPTAEEMYAYWNNGVERE